MCDGLSVASVVVTVEVLWSHLHRAMIAQKEGRWIEAYEWMKKAMVLCEQIDYMLKSKEGTNDPTGMRRHNDTFTE